MPVEAGVVKTVVVTVTIAMEGVGVSSLGVDVVSVSSDVGSESSYIAAFNVITDQFMVKTLGQMRLFYPEPHGMTSTTSYFLTTFITKFAIASYIARTGQFLSFAISWRPIIFLPG